MVDEATNCIGSGVFFSVCDKIPERGSRGLGFGKGCDPLTSLFRLCRTSECPSHCYASRIAYTCWSGGEFNNPTSRYYCYSLISNAGNWRSKGGRKLSGRVADLSDMNTERLTCKFTTGEKSIFSWSFGGNAIIDRMS